MPTEAGGSFIGDDDAVVLDHPVYGIDQQGILRVKGTGELVVSSSGQIQGLNEVVVVSLFQNIEFGTFAFCFFLSCMLFLQNVS